MVSAAQHCLQGLCAVPQWLNELFVSKVTYSPHTFAHESAARACKHAKNAASTSEMSSSMLEWSLLPAELCIESCTSSCICLLVACPVTALLSQPSLPFILPLVHADL